MTVRFSQKGAVLWAEIDRPEVLNAIDFSVMEGLEEALHELQTHRELRVFVLSGVGERAFAAGGDLRQFARLTSRAQVERMANRMQGILNAIEGLDCWTIACANGDAYGGGCETILAFDFRIASRQARFGFTQTRFHVPPGWGGLTRLVEAVGRRKALRWLAEAAVIDAEEAWQAGLLDRLEGPEELREATWQWAAALARQDRSLIGALKTGSLQARELPRSEAMARELPAFCELWLGEEHQRRVEAFLRRPQARGEQTSEEDS